MSQAYTGGTSTRGGFMKVSVRARIGGAIAWLVAASATCVHGSPAVDITVHADRPGAVIHPEIYGQFAEQLGHGIYGGIWVGEHSPIPNIKGSWISPS
ncbi:MAG TPA: hypothetical protein VK519_16465 [Pinirhizobacter sp.]|uniref:hypothetical protein n=1 Tax=Pinirhizobacter sp. TaxID=2950432 RepID=UPI002C656FEE|nr:hypothetical protein [Pinirhizobacter sp.]HMH69505.1 hypothetical protein [Pinirhizobacter sp.]